MQFISAKQVFSQLKRDLIGKDSHRGVTLTYSWLANQFGHFSLGFIPTFIVFQIIKKPGAESGAAFRAAVWVSLFWFLFELYNFLGPLFLKRSFKSVVRFRKKVVFVPAWKNIAFDTFTDLCFFWIGACTVSLILAQSTIMWGALIVLLFFIIWAGYHWYLTRIYLQAAQYPFQFRLSQWENAISEEDKKAVNDFLKKNDSSNHLFVFGPANAGKSSLCVGIGTEFSIGHARCLYTTVMKLFIMFFESPKASVTPDTFWTWRTTSFLVIDDVNAGHPIEPDLVSPETFLHFLRNESLDNDNIAALKEKNVIWVMGNEETTKDRQQAWKTLLHEIGVDDSKITTINLAANRNR